MKTNFFRCCCWLITACILILPSLTLGEEGLAQDVFAEALTRLNALSMADRAQAIEQLAAVKEPRAIVILQALLDGRLLKLKDADKLVIGTEIDTGFKVSDAKTGQDLGLVERDAVQKITVTNALRSSLRKTIGRLELSSEQVEVRKAAVQAIATSIDAEGLALLRGQMLVEQDESVQAEIKLVLGLEQLNSPDKNMRMTAIDLLKDHANQDVVNRLNALLEKNADGEFLETEADVRNSAKTALLKINSKLQTYAVVETLFFGLSLG
ncbi:MAG: urea ABC transporter permease subunit UrtB, partial [Methylococcales bacterium]